MPQKTLLGAHITIDDGLSYALTKGESIGCNVIQIFTKSNRQWKSKPIDPSIAKQFQSDQKHSSIKMTIAHASYLINLGSTNQETVEKSVVALIDELERCDILGIPYLVLHPGSGEKDNTDKTIEQVAQYINYVNNQTPVRNVSLLLENSAGQGQSIGRTFEELLSLYQDIKYKNKIGFCLDTCHAFAAGYDFRDHSGYIHMKRKLKDLLGLENIKVIHMNDSKNILGSNVDRHAMIGEGKLGLDAFSYIMNDHDFINIPKIIETPYEELADHQKDLETLKTLIKRN